MNIKVHTGIILALCTLTGITLAGYLTISNQEIEESAHQSIPNSLTKQRVTLLEESVKEWLIVNDLVLDRGEPFMVATSFAQAERLEKSLAEIANSKLVADRDAATLGLRTEIATLRQAILAARDLRGADAAARRQEIKATALAPAERLVDEVQKLVAAIDTRCQILDADLEHQRQRLLLLSGLGAGLYFGVILLCWLWTIHRIVKPIEDLSRAAEGAARHERPFVLPLEGPDEVRRLTHNISNFVSDLQAAKTHTEAEVRQRTAELVQANRAKSQFLATMSHELRTPLNGIINMNELMLETPLDPEQHGFARTAKNAAEALLALINDVLDFSKIEAGKLQLEAVDFDLRELVDGAVEILAGVAETKQLDLQAVVAPDVPLLVRGDSMRLRQIIINLLNNALKFTAEGNISVQVTTSTGAAGAPMLRFEVRDTGLGIPPERRAALFQAFEQVDSSTTRRFGGTGLGLAICRELAGLMGGAIGVDSVVGKGSTFWFTAQLQTVAVPTIPPVVTGAEVILISRRECVRERLFGQLQLLGLPADRLRCVADAADAKPVRAERAIVLVDPYGAGTHSFAAVDALRQRSGIETDRVGVLHHWLRRWPASLGQPPAEAIAINEPTRLDELRAWLEGRLLGTRELGRAGPAPVVASLPEPTLERTGPQLGRILVAEDAEVNQRVIRSVLERAGYTLRIVADGQQAIDAFAAERFDLVLMDCQMPILDGIEVTRRIRALEIDRSPLAPHHIPIVALTANAQRDFAEQCLAAGMDRFMTKPFRPHALLATLAELLKPAVGPRVLVVDDNQINLRVAQSVLVRAGYDVVLAEDGQQALDYLRQQPVALVLMDWQMPVLDGLQATRRIRELQASGELAAPRGDRLPIVAVTGNAQESERDQALAAGMDRVITKPFRPKELQQVVLEFAGPGKLRNGTAAAT